MKKLLAAVVACVLALCFAPLAFADDDLEAQGGNINAGTLAGTIYASQLKDDESYTLVGNTELVLDIDKQIAYIDSAGDNFLTVTGDAKLTVTGKDASSSNKHAGIFAYSFIMKSGRIEIGFDAFPEYGVFVKDQFKIEGGSLAMVSSKHGLHSERYINLAGGTVYTSGAEIGVWACYDDPVSFFVKDGMLVASGSKAAVHVRNVYTPSVPTYPAATKVHSKSIDGFDGVTYVEDLDVTKVITNIVVNGYQLLETDPIMLACTDEQTPKIGEKVQFTMGLEDDSQYEIYCEEWIDLAYPEESFSSLNPTDRVPVAGREYKHRVTLRARTDIEHGYFQFNAPAVSYNGEDVSSMVTKIESLDHLYVAVEGLWALQWMGGFDRLSGDNALETMTKIVDEGHFAKEATVVLASVEGYWDALTAAGVAGLYNAPVIMTAKNELSAEAKAQLEKLRPSRVIVCGGESALSEKVKQEAIAAAGASEAPRYSGETAVETSLAVYQQVTGWSDTAIIATVGTFQDALSAGPVAWSQKMPIFLAKYDWATGKGTISEECLKAMKDGGITKAYIVGGEYWISKDAEKQLTDAKITLVKRLAGDNAVETSKQVAQTAVSDLSMHYEGLGVASCNVYQDALAGAALCGKNKAPLLLVNDEKSSTIDGIVKKNKTAVRYGHVFGGTASVSGKVFTALNDALK